MSLVQVGDIYINERRLAGVTDVQQNVVPGDEGHTSYSFAIFLEGGETSVLSRDQAQAKKWHTDLVNLINPGFRFASGGVTLAYTAVNIIGPVYSDPATVDRLKAAFAVGMDGVTVNLRYPDERQATQGRNELIAKASG